jgi:hypothetical protein
MLIRHFTDSPEKKHERQAVTDARADQLRMAYLKSRDARDYSVIRDRIAQDFYRAAGVREKAVAPTLGREQIAELNKYADTLPFFSTDRREFKEAARIAEESLLRSEASEAARTETEQLRAHAFSDRTVEQLASHDTSNTQRSDRDSYSRGR